MEKMLAEPGGSYHIRSCILRVYREKLSGSYCWILRRLRWRRPELVLRRAVGVERRNSKLRSIAIALGFQE
jgi:hypothetical protein